MYVINFNDNQKQIIMVGLAIWPAVVIFLISQKTIRDAQKVNDSIKKNKIQNTIASSLYCLRHFKQFLDVYKQSQPEFCISLMKHELDTFEKILLAGFEVLNVNYYWRFNEIMSSIDSCQSNLPYLTPSEHTEFQKKIIQYIENYLEKLLGDLAGLIAEDPELTRFVLDHNIEGKLIEKHLKRLSKVGIQ